MPRVKSRTWVLQLVFVPLFLIFIGLFGYFEQWFGWEGGPMGLHYGIWFLCFASYIVLIVTTIIYFVIASKND